MRVAAAAVAVLAVVIPATMLTPGSVRAAPLPVSYDFWDGTRAELSHPGGSLPGSNDADCRVSRAHPRPVVLVHGSGANRQTTWATIVPALKNEGYCVFALTYGATAGATWPVSALGGLATVESSAEQLARFIRTVLAHTGARQVDVVGHSTGTVIPDYYAKYLGGAATIHDYVSLAPYWRGHVADDTCDAGKALYTAVGRAAQWPYPECQQEYAGADLIRKLWRGGTPYAAGVRYTNIVTDNDGIVDPYDSGLVAGPDAVNVLLQRDCAADRSDHLRLVANPRVVRIILNTLDPAHRRPVPCLSVMPVLG